MVGGDVQSTWMPPAIKHKAATWPEAGQKNTVEVDRSARHTRPMIHHAHPGSWDGSWYRVHTEHFEAAFLPNAGEDLESVDNVDVFVDLNDGSRWSATLITLAQVEILMRRWAASGESLGGRYFWSPGGLIVRDAGISNMTQVLAGLIETGEFTQVLHRLDD